MSKEFQEGIKILKQIQIPCLYHDFWELANEVLPGRVFFSQEQYHSEAHYQFYSFSIYSYEYDEDIVIGEEEFQIWTETNEDEERVITNFR